MSKKVLVIGDSIVNGNSDFEFGGWVNRLRIEHMKKQSELSFQNLGVSGDDSFGILKRLRNEIEKYIYVRTTEFEIIFSFGTNDSRFKSSLNSNKIIFEDFKDNLIEILKICEDYNIKPIFTGILKVDESKTAPSILNSDNFWYNEQGLKYNNYIEEFCNKNNLYFIDNRELLDTKEDLFDGLHPNPKGHRKIYEFMKLQLSKLL